MSRQATRTRPPPSSISSISASEPSLHLLSALVHRIHALLTTVLIYLVSLGPIPRHVAFVMDGNRRYARGRGQKVVEGHTEGFKSLRRTLEICLKLKIRAVSVYAFSIDNFKRSQDEVDALMDLARVKLLELCTHGDLLEKYGVRIRFIGRRELLPPEVLETVLQMENITRDNPNGVLNVCCPYTSRDETATAVRDVVQEVYDGQLSLQHIDQDCIYNHLETCQTISGVSESEDDTEADCGKIDIFVRTSNVKRLSDFLMWQAGNDTQLHFVKTYWPEFGLTDMLPILLGWQQKVWLRSMGW